MDSFGMQQEKQKQEQAAVKLSYADQQKTGWEVTENFRKTAKADGVLGAKYSRYDTMDMPALRDELIADTDHKTFTYTAMQNAIDNLLKLSATKGKVENGLDADFFETLFTAKAAVNQYLYNHAGYRWTGKGEKRVQISLRLKSILNSLDQAIAEKSKTLSAEAARNLEYDKEQLTAEERAEREKTFKANKTAEDIMMMVESCPSG